MVTLGMVTTLAYPASLDVTMRLSSRQGHVEHDRQLSALLAEYERRHCRL
jgi:hypothetical protein